MSLLKEIFGILVITLCANILLAAEEFVIQLSKDQWNSVNGQSDWQPAFSSQVQSELNFAYANPGSVKEFCYQSASGIHRVVLANPQIDPDLSQSKNYYQIDAQLVNSVDTPHLRSSVAQQQDTWMIATDSRSQPSIDIKSFAINKHDRHYGHQISEKLTYLKKKKASHICYYNINNQLNAWYNIQFFIRSDFTRQEWNDIQDMYGLGNNQCKNNEIIALQYSAIYPARRRPICISNNPTTTTTTAPVPPPTQLPTHGVRGAVGGSSSVYVDPAGSTGAVSVDPVRGVPKFAFRAMKFNLGLKRALPKRKNDFLSNSAPHLNGDWPSPNVIDPNIINIDKLQNDMENTYPIYHKDIIDDIYMKIKNSKSGEIFDQYRDSRTGKPDVLEYINDRLIEKRALYFYGANEKNLLVDGKTQVPEKEWEISTDEHLNYEEMLFNAKSGMSSPTQFINTGGRFNRGTDDRSNVATQDAYYIGLVGARFEKRGVMEHKEIVDPTTDTIDLNKLKERLKISMELFLFDANHRGIQSGKNVYAHIVGIGAGVWSFNGDSDTINKVIFEVTEDIVKTTRLSNIEVINFSWMDVYPPMSNKIINDVSGKSIRLQYNGRDPASKLNIAGDNDSQCNNCIIVAMYAWDSNSLPGNEFWEGQHMLQASGDPAAAACSTISITQNPWMNSKYVAAENALVYKKNVVQSSYEVFPLPRYVDALHLVY